MLIVIRYNNFIQYLRSWQPPPLSGITIDPANRPPPIAVFKDNVTVQGSWVDSISTEGIGQKYNRSITNVTMAMPHTGVSKLVECRVITSNFSE